MQNPERVNPDERDKVDLAIDGDQLIRGMVAVLFIADAVAAADAEQRVLIQQIVAGLDRPIEQGGTPLRTVMLQVADAVPGWSPSDETLDYMESLTGRKFR